MGPAPIKTLKWLSAMLALTVLAVVVVFLVRYRGNRPLPRAPLRTLPDKVASETYKIHYVEHRDGRPFLEVFAERNVSTKDNRHTLKGVRAKYLAESSEAPGPTMIDADECIYSAGDNSIRFLGQVVVRRSDGAVLSSRDVLFEKASDTVAGDAPFRFDRTGLHGSGQGFRMNMNTRVLEILRDARVLYEPAPGEAPPAVVREGAIHFTAARAILQDREKRAGFSGGCRLESSASSLEGAAMEVLGTPDNRCREVLVTGGAGCRRRENGREGSLRAGTIRFVLADDGQTLRTLEARGGASLATGASRLSAGLITVQARPDGALDQLAASEAVHYDGVEGSASAGVLTAQFAGPDALSRMELNGNARVGRTEGGAGSTIRAPRIRFAFANDAARKQVLETLEAENGCDLDVVAANGTSVKGQCTSFTQRLDRTGRNPSTTEARGKCDFTLERPRGGEKVRIRAEEVSFGFFPASPDIRSLAARGGVRLGRSVPNAGLVETESDTLQAEFSPADRSRLASLLQTGHFRYNERGRSAEAGEASLDGDLLTLRNKPVIRTPDGSLRATTVTVDNRSRTMTGRGAVEVERSSAGGRADAGDFPLPGRPGQSGGPVWIQSESVVVEESNSRATFRGNCRMIRQDTRLAASSFVLNGGNFVAEGNVSATVPLPEGPGASRVMQLKAGRLTFDGKRKKLLLENGVEMNGQDGNLAANVLWGFLDGKGELKTVYARGGVTFRQNERKATGDAMVYDLAAGRGMLGGQPASVTDPRGGRSTKGARLTFYKGEDKVLIEQSGTVPLVE